MYTIEKAKEAVANGIKGYLLKDEKGNYVMEEVNRLPFYLEGRPGIGKTQIVRQIAEELGIGYVSFSLVHHTRNSLLGLPVITELESGDKYTRYTMSEIIAKVLEQAAQGKKEGILLLDEFPCMSETIWPTMLAFLQTKNIGTHHLPEGWVLVLCGNPPAYNKTARTFDSAVMDRIRKLEIVFEPTVFSEYGKKIGIHEAILDYLEVHKDNTYRYENKSGSMELVTCRGWENLSHMIYAYEKLNQKIEKEDVEQFIKSEGIALDFYQFYKQYRLGLGVQCAADVLAGMNTEYYEQQFQKLNYSDKWKQLEYIAGYTEKIGENVIREKAMLQNCEMIRKQLKKNRKKRVEDLPVTKNGSCRLKVSGLVSYLNQWLSYLAPEQYMEEVLSFGEWLEERPLDELGLERNFEVTPENFLGNVYYWWNKWYEEELLVYELTLKEISEKLKNLLVFAEKIDKDHAVIGLLYNYINNSEILLTAFSKFPSEEYLKYSAERYNMYFEAAANEQRFL